MSNSELAERSRQNQQHNGLKSLPINGSSGLHLHQTENICRQKKINVGQMISVYIWTENILLYTASQVKTINFIQVDQNSGLLHIASY